MPPLLKLFLWWSGVLVFLCGGVEVFCARVLHLHYPFNFPIFNPGAIAFDLMALQGQFQHFHQLDFFQSAGICPFAYPATGSLPYWLMFHFGKHTMAAFYILSLLSLFALGTGLAHAWYKRGIAPAVAAAYLGACLLCSYPFWFELKDANVEIVLFVLIALGVWAFFREWFWWAAVLFGVAAAMKIYPAIYLALFLSRRKYLQAALTPVVAVAMNFFSLWALSPNVSHTSKEISGLLHWYRTYAMLGRLFPEIGFDHSAFALIKACLVHMPSAAVLSPWLNLYMAVTAVLGIALYFLRIRKLPMISQVLCLTVSSLVLTPFSEDYTLIHLYIPWALLTLLILDHPLERIRGLKVIVCCFVLLCAPLSEFIVRGRTIEGQIKAVVLLVLLYAALRYPLMGGEREPQPTA